MKAGKLALCVGARLLMLLGDARINIAYDGTSTLSPGAVAARLNFHIAGQLNLQRDVMSVLDPAKGETRLLVNLERGEGESGEPRWSRP